MEQRSQKLLNAGCHIGEGQGNLLQGVPSSLELDSLEERRKSNRHERWSQQTDEGLGFAFEEGGQIERETE